MSDTGLVLLDLPHDVLAKILQYFFLGRDYKTFFQLGSSCTSLYKVFSSDLIWNDVLLDFSGVFGRNERGLLKSISTQHANQVRRFCASLKSFAMTENSSMFATPTTTATVTTTWGGSSFGPAIVINPAKSDSLNSLTEIERVVYLCCQMPRLEKLILEFLFLPDTFMFGNSTTIPHPTKAFVNQSLKYLDLSAFNSSNRRHDQLVGRLFSVIIPRLFPSLEYMGVPDGFTFADPERFASLKYLSVKGTTAMTLANRTPLASSDEEPELTLSRIIFPSLELVTLCEARLPELCVLQQFLTPNLDDSLDNRVVFRYTLASFYHDALAPPTREDIHVRLRPYFSRYVCGFPILTWMLLYFRNHPLLMEDDNVLLKTFGDVRRADVHACLLCNKQFVSQATLLQHVKSRHPGEVTTVMKESMRAMKMHQKDTGDELIQVMTYWLGQYGGYVADRVLSDPCEYTGVLFPGNSPACCDGFPHFVSNTLILINSAYQETVRTYFTFVDGWNAQSNDYSCLNLLSRGQNLLHVLCWSSHLSEPNAMLLIRKCVDMGVNINARDDFGLTPLMCATCSRVEKSPQFFDFLVSVGADPLATVGNGYSILWFLIFDCLYPGHADSDNGANIIDDFEPHVEKETSSAVTAGTPAQSLEKFRQNVAYFVSLGVSINALFKFDLISNIHPHKMKILLSLLPPDATLSIPDAVFTLLHEMGDSIKKSSGNTSGSFGVTAETEAEERQKFINSAINLNLLLNRPNFHILGRSKKYQNNIVQVLFYNYYHKWPNAPNPIAPANDAFNLCQQTYCEILLNLVVKRVEVEKQEEYKALFTDKNVDGWNALHFLHLPYFKYPDLHDTFDSDFTFSAKNNFPTAGNNLFAGSQLKCFHCQESWHATRDCLVGHNRRGGFGGFALGGHNRHQKLFPSELEETMLDASEFVCYTCLKPGHYTSKCPLNQFNFISSGFALPRTSPVATTVNFGTTAVTTGGTLSTSASAINWMTESSPSGGEGLQFGASANFADSSDVVTGSASQPTTTTASSTGLNTISFRTYDTDGTATLSTFTLVDPSANAATTTSGFSFGPTGPASQSTAATSTAPTTFSFATPVEPRSTEASTETTSATATTTSSTTTADASSNDALRQLVQQGVGLMTHAEEEKGGEEEKSEKDVLFPIAAESKPVSIQELLKQVPVDQGTFNSAFTGTCDSTSSTTTSFHFGSIDKVNIAETNSENSVIYTFGTPLPVVPDSIQFPWHFHSILGYAKELINGQSGYGETPLLLTCMGNQITLGVGQNRSSVKTLAYSVAKELLLAGADPNIADNYGYTPLHAATLNCNPGLVELLLKNKADPSARDKSGHSPLHLALLLALARNAGPDSGNQWTGIEMIDFISILNVLILADANLDTTDVPMLKSKSFLSHAIYLDNIHLLNTLVKGKKFTIADVNNIDPQSGRLPICEVRSSPVATVLVERFGFQWTPESLGMLAESMCQNESLSFIANVAWESTSYRSLMYPYYHPRLQQSKSTVTIPTDYNPSTVVGNTIYGGTTIANAASQRLNNNNNVGGFSFGPGFDASVSWKARVIEYYRKKVTENYAKNPTADQSLLVLKLAKDANNRSFLLRHFISVREAIAAQTSKVRITLNSLEDKSARNQAITAIRMIWFNDMGVFPLVQFLNLEELNQIDNNGECLFSVMLSIHKALFEFISIVKRINAFLAETRLTSHWSFASSSYGSAQEKDMSAYLLDYNACIAKLVYLWKLGCSIERLDPVTQQPLYFNFDPYVYTAFELAGFRKFKGLIDFTLLREAIFANRPQQSRFNSAEDLRMLLTFCTSQIVDPYRNTGPSAITTSLTGFASTTTASSTSTPFATPLQWDANVFEKLNNLATFSLSALDEIQYAPKKYNFVNQLCSEKSDVPLCYRMLWLMTQKNRFAIELFNHLAKFYVADGLSDLLLLQADYVDEESGDTLLHLIARYLALFPIDFPLFQAAFASPASSGVRRKQLELQAALIHSTPLYSPSVASPLISSMSAFSPTVIDRESQMKGLLELTRHANFMRKNKAGETVESIFPFLSPMTLSSLPFST